MRRAKQGIDWWEGFGESAPLSAMQGIDWWAGFGESAPLTLFHTGEKNKYLTWDKLLAP